MRGRCRAVRSRQFLQKSVAYYVMDADKWRYADTLEADHGGVASLLSGFGRQCDRRARCRLARQRAGQGQARSICLRSARRQHCRARSERGSRVLDGPAPGARLARQAARLSHRAVRARHGSQRLLQADRLARDRSARHRLRDDRLRGASRRQLDRADRRHQACALSRRACARRSWSRRASRCVTSSMASRSCRGCCGRAAGCARDRAP